MLDLMMMMAAIAPNDPYRLAGRAAAATSKWPTITTSSRARTARPPSMTSAGRDNDQSNCVTLRERYDPSIGSQAVWADFTRTHHATAVCVRARYLTVGIFADDGSGGGAPIMALVTVAQQIIN